jgi:ABC-type lipoprotein release transport system permease subunit
MQALLFGVNPADPSVFLSALGMAAIMTLAGSLLPAWRAVRVDPIAATRTE